MEEEKKVGETQLVVFSLEKEEFACDIMNVREVLKMLKVTPLPRSLEYVEGVINLRGKVIPVLDLRKRFGLPAVERTGDSRIIIIEVDDRMIGLIVDSVSEVVRLYNNQIQDAPEEVSGKINRLILGVGKIDDRLLIILNLEFILSTEEHIALEDITGTGRELAGELSLSGE